MPGGDQEGSRHQKSCVLGLCGLQGSRVDWLCRALVRFFFDDVSRGLGLAWATDSAEGIRRALMCLGLVWFAVLWGRLSGPAGYCMLF